MSIPFKFLSSNLKILSQFEINLHQNFAKSLLKAKTLYEKKTPSTTIITIIIQTQIQILITKTFLNSKKKMNLIH